MIITSRHSFLFHHHSAQSNSGGQPGCRLCCQDVSVPTASGSVGSHFGARCGVAAIENGLPYVVCSGLDRFGLLFAISVVFFYRGLV